MRAGASHRPSSGPARPGRARRARPVRPGPARAACRRAGAGPDLHLVGPAGGERHVGHPVLAGGHHPGAVGQLGSRQCALQARLAGRGGLAEGAGRCAHPGRHERVGIDLAVRMGQRAPRSRRPGSRSSRRTRHPSRARSSAVRWPTLDHGGRPPDAERGEGSRG